VCVSLLTAVAGRRARGRVYLPANVISVDQSGNYQPNQLGGLAIWFADFLTGLNSTETPQHVGVLSQKFGTFQSVNVVKIDSKPDIQRRRANKQTPTSVSTAIVT
jgi:hypothetical protein